MAGKRKSHTSQTLERTEIRLLKGLLPKDVKLDLVHGNENNKYSLHSPSLPDVSGQSKGASSRHEGRIRHWKSCSVRHIGEGHGKDGGVHHHQPFLASPLPPSCEQDDTRISDPTVFHRMSMPNLIFHVRLSFSAMGSSAGRRRSGLTTRPK